MSIHEECGVFGVISPKPVDVANISYYGLYALQHRGQESCGIVVNDDGVFVSHKDLGLVGDVFLNDILSSLPSGTMAVGHVRYGTTGGTNRNNCQPIEVNHQKGRMALAHNGNLSNAAKLRNELELSGAIFHTTSDTETIAYIVTRERLNAPSIEDALSRAMNTLDGAYSLVLMSPQKLICARDPYGFRPLCYGQTPDGTYIVASESCAIKAVGGEVIRDVEPGEILVFSKHGVVSRKEHCNQKEKRLCIFEYIYFARPDSVIDGISVHASRVLAGKILAQTHPIDADIVIGAPDSGLDAALGFSQESKIPYGIGLIKNKYIGRTFISPGQGARLDSVKIKLSAVEESIRGKRVVLIDDSIVRGNTIGRVVQLLRNAGAKEVHIRISSPMFLHPCYYGTDIDSEDHLIACKHTVSEIAEIIGADSLGYFPLEKLRELTSHCSFCSACFDGCYPTAIPDDTRKDRFEKRLSDIKESSEYNRKLILEDGQEYYGDAFGDTDGSESEIVFNTSMVGYQEILSDLSYTGQAVVMTYPLIGNYGMAKDDYETITPTIGALIVREYNDVPSNFRSESTLGKVMSTYKIPGIYGIDTRRLTRSIRDHGSQKVLLTDVKTPVEKGLNILAATALAHDSVARVSCQQTLVYPSDTEKFHIVAIDCGIKMNIIHSLNTRGCKVTCVPWNTPAEVIETLSPDGIFISNGPGDPTDVPQTITAIKELIGKYPIFGICLGHQIISLAYGAKTYKLKFGHRGGNHPVKNLKTNKIEITSQNHSYAVDADSLLETPLSVTHINLLDQTVEGVVCERDRVFSVQYHPESAPGPQDSTYLFDQFITLIKEGCQHAEKNRS